MKTQSELRALTLWRPWPHAIFFGGKRLENRPWKPWKTVISHFIALHAGLKYDSDGAKAMREMDLYDPPEDGWCPKGCIVGVARVTGFIEEAPAFSDPQHDWYSGPCAWTLEDVVPFVAPVKATGGRGLWLIEDELKRQVRDAHLVGLAALREGKSETYYREMQKPRY